MYDDNVIYPDFITEAIPDPSEPGECDTQRCLAEAPERITFINPYEPSMSRTYPRSADEKDVGLRSDPSYVPEQTTQPQTKDDPLSEIDLINLTSRNLTLSGKEWDWAEG